LGSGEKDQRSVARNTLRRARIHGDPARIFSRAIEAGTDTVKFAYSSGKALKVSAYMAKPITQAELWKALSRVLSQSAAAMEPPVVIARHTLREGQPRWRILAAEDYLVNPKLVIPILEKQGHTVVVDNAQAAQR
jgi:CheY-like chemotaxis protein